MHPLWWRHRSEQTSCCEEVSREVSFSCGEVCLVEMVEWSLMMQFVGFTSAGGGER